MLGGVKQVLVILRPSSAEESLGSCAYTVGCAKSPFSLSTGSSSAEEMVTLLVQAGLFDTAISLCQTFKLPLTPVFEGLAFKYV